MSEEEKNCGNCEYEKVNPFIKPCSKCFTPTLAKSKWKAKIKDTSYEDTMDMANKYIEKYKY